MRTKIYKILRIKITILLMVIVFCFIALQTPWLKRIIAYRVLEKLSIATQSKVEVKGYEGFIPLNFDFYELTFSQNKERWLTLDRLSLNRTLLRFFLWKNRAIDVSLIHPNLLQKPHLTSDTQKIEHEEESFQWPEFPFQQLSIHLECFQVEINPSLTTKVLPKFNAFNDLHIRKSGEILDLHSKLNSIELPGVEIHLSLEANRNKNNLALEVHFQDLNRKVTQYFTTQKIPEFNGEMKVSGSPESMISFFNPQKKSVGTFEGDIKGRFLPSQETSDFFAELLDEKNLVVSSHFKFEENSGLNFSSLSVEGANLNFKGEGILTPDFQFQETTLKGSIKRLKLTSYVMKQSVEGKLEIDAKLSGPFEHPKVTAFLKSPRLETDYLIAQKVNGNISIQKENFNFEGNLSLTCEMNQVNSSLNTQFSLSTLKDLSLEKFGFNYGPNLIETEHFKVLENGTLFDGNIGFNLRDLSHFSPFVKHTLDGNVEGYAKLDIDFAQPKRLQKLAVVLQGEHFLWTQLELKQYYLQVVGQIHELKIEDFEGNLIFKNQKMLWKHYDFLETELNLNPKNRVSPYSLQTSGNLSISSSGQIEKDEEKWNLFVRTLEGNALGQTYRLTQSCDLHFMKKNLSFSPINLKIGAGHLYLNLDSKEQSLQTQTEKFPIDFFSLFDPQFDLKGYLDLNGSLFDLSSSAQGDISGSFYQFSIGEYQNMSPFKGAFNFSFTKGSLEGKATFFERKSDEGMLELKLPLHFSFYPFRLKLNPQDSAFANLIYKGKVNPFIQMWLPQNHLLEGQTEIAFNLKGPLIKPSVHGYATLKHGYYENLYLGLVLKNITSKLEADGERVRLSHFIADDDFDGKVQAMGDVILNFKKHMPFKLDVDMSKGRVIQFDFLEAAFTGDLKLKGNLKGAELKGNLDVLEANITIPSYIGSGLPKLPVTYLYPRNQNCPSSLSPLTPFIPIYFDIHLNVANNVKLKGRGLDTVWEGKLDIRGNDKKPHFEGQLNNTEGSFAFAGQVLSLEKGHIQFDGDLLKNTQINLVGQTVIRNAKILAYLQGPLLGPKLSFTSNPPYSETEILSLILFNEPLPKLTPFQAVALTHSLSTLSGAYLGPDILDKVRRGIGVDQLTFGSAIAKGNKYDTIQVGKYITRNVLITLNRPLSVGTSPFVITAHIKGGIELQTYFDENELSKILIQWKLSY